MAYTPISADTFRHKQSTKSGKLAEEFEAISVETDSLKSQIDTINDTINERVKIDSAALNFGNANDISFAWENQEDSAIFVQRVVIDITVAGGTAGSLMDIGPAETAAGTSDTIIDGLDINQTGAFDNISDAGTNGTSLTRLDANGGTTTFITGKILVENAAGLEGTVYIQYVRAN